MIVDENHYRDLMLMISALSADEKDVDKEVLDGIKKRSPIILQQGRALLDKSKKKFDQKFTLEAPNWKDFIS